jgi:transposase-like protein
VSNAHNSDNNNDINDPIQDRRKKVKTLLSIQERRESVQLALSMGLSESQIAKKLGVNQATINRDKHAIKKESQQWIYKLAQSDIAYYYKQALDSLGQAKRRAWEICDSITEQTLNVDKAKLLALKTVISADEAAIKLLDGGPSILNMQTMENRLSEIEGDQENVE